MHSPRSGAFEHVTHEDASTGRDPYRETDADTDENNGTEWQAQLLREALGASAHDDDHAETPDDLLSDVEEQLERLASDQETDPYAILNVEKDASAETIRDAYKRLCVLFHPDKQGSTHGHTVAAERFQQVQAAYAIVSDPVKRAVYDAYGFAGLRQAASEQWQVAQKLSTPREIQAEFARRALERRRADVNALVRASGEVGVSLDATRLFSGRSGASQPRTMAQLKRQLALPPGTRPPAVAVAQAHVKHSWDTSLDERTRVTLSGAAVGRTGRGGAGGRTAADVTVAVKRQWTRKWATEAAASVGPSAGAQLRGIYTPTSDSFVALTAASHTLAAPPTGAIVLGRALGSHMTGYFTLKSGDWRLGSWGADAHLRQGSAVGLGIARRAAVGHELALNLNMGVDESQVVASFKRPIAQLYRGKVTGGLSTSTGVFASVMLERRCGRDTRVGLESEVNTVQGVAWKLRVARLGQRLVVPVLVVGEFSVAWFLAAFAAPAAALVALDWWVLRPRARMHRERRIAAARERYQGVLAQQRSNAVDSLRLLLAPALKRRAAETCSGGLVILEALYGVGPFPAPPVSSQEWQLPSPTVDQKAYADFAVALQTMVADGQLALPGRTVKSSLLGFFDPSFGDEKVFRVTYLYRGNLHVAQVKDEDRLEIPLRSHAVRGERGL